MKKWLFIPIIVILVIAWFLISPIFIDKELNEASPLDSLTEDKKTELQLKVEEMKDEIVELEETMPFTSEIILKGDFNPSAHEVSGQALVIDAEKGKVLRFENFETINGPDLFIYLSSSLDNEDFIDLGKIKATKGNVNYELPEDINLEKYNKVLIWCVPFRVLFSYAELEEKN